MPLIFFGPDLIGKPVPAFPDHALSRLAAEFRVARLFKLERELGSARPGNTTVVHDMHAVRHDVVQKPLIVGDDEHRALLGAKCVHAFGYDAERVDIETGIGLVEHAKLWL